MREDLKAYVDGELSPLKRWLLSRKIAADPQLQKEVEGLRRLSTELGALHEPTVLSETLRARLLASAPVAAPTRRPVSRLALGGALGGLVAASLAALILLRPAPPGTTSNLETAPPASVALSEPPELTASAAHENEATLGAGAPPALANAARADVEVLVGVALPDEAAIRRIERRVTAQGGVRVSREGEPLTFQVPRAKVLSLRDELLQGEGRRNKGVGKLLRVVLRPVD